MFIDYMIGFILSLSIALTAYLKHSLVKSGLIAAIFIGTFIYVFGGLTLWVVLISFFISSSLLTKLHEKKEDSPDKGRNYLQVISNGLVPAIFSILYYYLNSEIFLIAAAASIATSNSDTWASEIGILSKGKTRNVINFKVVEKGISGGVTRLGTIASLIGALFIGLIFSLMYLITFGVTFEILLTFTLIITLCGFLGCLIDSYLGSVIQAKYRGIDSGKISEKKWLTDEKVILVSGIVFITNDTVNFLSSLIASFITIIFLM